MLRALLFVMMALGFVGIGAVAWIGLRPPPAQQQQDAQAVAPAVVPEAPPPPPQRISVLVAARNLRAGALLRNEDLVARMVLASEMPADARQEGRESRTAIQGALIRRGLREGEPVLDSDIMMPGDRGYLAAALSPDMRAIPIAVDQISGAAGLIWPGDRVDVVLTQQLPSNDSVPLTRRMAGETIVNDVRVIAVDQNLVQGALSEGGDGGFRPARVITLEVTVPQAERLSVARRLGVLSLLVRPAQDAIPTDAVAVPVPGGVVWGGDASAALRQGQNTLAPATTMQIFRGRDERQEVRF
ncbi:Flp pilus assembly protein CpaB [Plastoroseomonas hellenica]|uniref:Flp pilus assembly protein CpaB n=1 Tax=Plastoroseomonas hellenica TaxID=2687306 RepID=UPI001BAA98A0|nr:Flp pilus assembly protein CpaB [Plastoroseomonas hellenica]MBR0642109.1 Flp pilus assembly protein CpaB [Plastoroseomonas hellenica]